MKNRLLIPFASFLVIALAAFGCHKESSESTTATTDTTSTMSTASTTSPTDTASTVPTDTAATSSSATSTTGTNPASTPLNEADQKDAIKFAGGDLGEVAVGKLAASKTTDPEVKSFAEKLVTDHTNATNDLKKVASAKNLTLPTGTDSEHQKFVDELNKLSGKAFDKKFVEDMVEDHDKDVKDFEKASKEVKDPDLKAWVEKTLPVLKQHDQIAHDLKKKMK